MNVLKEAFKYAPRLLAAVATGGTSELGRAALSVAADALGYKDPQPDPGDVMDAMGRLSPEQLREMEIRFKEIELEKIREQNRADEAAAKQVTERAAKLEGTASDLAQMPVLGRLMLFLRGSQRPIWGFFVILLDFKVFAGDWEIVGDDYIGIIWLINLLVLGFLFGERALKNLEPMIFRIMDRYVGPKA